MDKEEVMPKNNTEHITLGIGILIFLGVIFLLFGKLHVFVFVVLLIISYKVTDYYVVSLNNNSENSFTCWPNILVLYDATKNWKEELRRKQLASSVYIQKNPWANLMISKRIDSAITRFCSLCLRDFIYPWLTKITYEDSLVLETKYVIRHLLATILRRLQNTDINAFCANRLVPLVIQTLTRYVETKEVQSSDDSVGLLREMYNDDLHVAMHTREKELKYLKTLLYKLLPIIAPEFIDKCKASRHFLCELFTCKVLLDGIDATCRPNTLNRLFHLCFTNAIQRQQRTTKIQSTNEPNRYVELLSHFCAMNGSLHKNQLALDLTYVMNEHELRTSLIKALDKSGSLSLLRVYIKLADILNDIPLTADMLVREEVYEQLIYIDRNYLTLSNPKYYLAISNPYDEQDTLMDDVKHLIYHVIAQSLSNENATQSDTTNKPFDYTQPFSLLSKFHCKIYELIQEKFQREYLTSFEHYFYICGPCMELPSYQDYKHSFDDLTSDFVHIEEIRNANESTQRRTSLHHYTTTSYQGKGRVSTVEDLFT